MAEYAYNLYCKDAKFVDLQKIELPMCDGDKCYDNPNENQPDKSTNLADNNVHFICNGLVTTLRCNDYMLGTKNALCREDTQKCDAFAKGAPGNELDL